MRLIRVTSVFMGINLLVLVLSLIAPVLAPQTAIADGGGGDPPIHQPPPDTSGGSSVPPAENPEDDLSLSGESISWLDLVLIQLIGLF